MIIYNTLENNDFQKSFYGFNISGSNEQSNIFKNTIDLYTYNTMYYIFFKRILYSLWKYDGLPEHILKRNAEEPLIYYGKSCVFKNDSNLVDIMSFTATKYDRYFNPIEIDVLSPYDTEFNNIHLVDGDFSVVYNNTAEQSSNSFLLFLGSRLANIERQIDVNIQAIKNPRIWQVPKDQMIAIENAINDINSNDSDIILSDQHRIEDIIKVNQANCNYFCDKLEELKLAVINDILTFLGISNLGAVEKKERLITAEVQNNNIINNLTLDDMLECRKIGYDKANKKFGTNISVSINPVIEVEDINFTETKNADFEVTKDE